jgi:hypothetical protein
MSSRIRIELIGSDAGLCAAWTSYVGCCPSATIYHDLAWRDIFAEGLGYRAFCLLALAEDDRRVVGALPLFEVPSLLGRPRLVAVPFRDRGGPLYDTVEALDSLLTTANRQVEETRAAGLVVKLLSPLPKASVARANLLEKWHWVHSVANLRGVDESELWRRLGDKTRNMIRQAERAGLVFQDDTDDPDAARIWYRLHLKTQRNLGLPPFPQRFFALMIERLRASGKVRVFAARRPDSTPVAATIVLLEDSRAIYAYGAADPMERRARPTDYLLHKVLCWLIDHAIAELDMGSDAPEQESLLFFKRKFLAQQATIPVYFSQGVAMETSDSSAPRYRLARRFVQCIPEALLAPLLSPAIRYFG